MRGYMPAPSQQSGQSDEQHKLAADGGGYHHGRTHRLYVQRQNLSSLDRSPEPRIVRAPYLHTILRRQLVVNLLNMFHKFLGVHAPALEPLEQ